MPEGKYFYIKSKLNDLVLDVKGASSAPKTHVITWSQKPRENADNQLWYEDHLNGVIKSKQSDLCLDISDGNDLMINHFDAKRDNQQWLIAGNRVQNRVDPERVLDIAGKKKSAGAKVCAWKAHGELNQQWAFEYLPPRYFCLRNVSCGKVVDVKGQKREVGAKLVIMERAEPPTDSQLWYEDRHGMICSKMHGYVFDTSDDNKLRLYPFEPGNNKQLWIFADNFIVNKTLPNLTIDLKGAHEKNGTKLRAAHWDNKDHQRWVMEFV